MSTLAIQQSWMQRLVVDGGEGRPLLREGGTSLVTRLGIYQTAYRARLAESLKLNFPILRLIVGDECFDTLAQGFIAARPSRRRSIRWFGEELEAFAAENPDRLPHPSLLDLIKLEWATCLAFDAADEPILTREKLAAVPPDRWHQISFAPHPSVRVLAMAWRVEPAFEALCSDESAETDVPEPGRHSTLVWRLGLGPRWRVLDENEAAVIEAAVAGRTFAELCDFVAITHGANVAAHRVATYLQQWVSDGILADR